MLRRTAFASALALSAVATAFSAVGTGGVAGASTAQSCAKLTKAAVVADGFTKATCPIVTPYNYAKGASNPANALGTTYDFGAKALVIGCVSPADLKQLSIEAQGAKKPTMSATAYMNYMVKQSAGAMMKTKVGQVWDYLDYGDGKQDGLGSTAKAGTVRLDAWVANNYIVLGFISPVATKAPPALLNLITTTLKVLK